MKNILLIILKKYLEIFPEEKDRQTELLNYLNSHEDNEITNWNNFDGHIVAGGFIYSKKDNKFLVLYHKDLKIYLYPGGHIDANDKNPLEASKREIQEETGLFNLEQLLEKRTFADFTDAELLKMQIEIAKLGLKLDNKLLTCPKELLETNYNQLTVEQYALQEKLNVINREKNMYERMLKLQKDTNRKE